MLDQPSRVKNLLDDLPPHLAERSRLFSSGRADRSQSVSGSDTPSGELSESVVYWTHHALRVDENPSLDVACCLANKLHLPLLVYQGVSENYRFASDRHHWFSLQGAQDLSRSYRALGIRYAFHLDRRDYRVPALKWLASRANLLVTDDFPGEPTQAWTERLRATSSVPIVLVDSSCVVSPILVGKAFDRAYAYRQATSALYRERVSSDWPAVTELPTFYDGRLPFEPLELESADIPGLLAQCDIDHSIGPVTDTLGGSTAGYERWENFKRKQISRYEKHRNDPTSNASSRMSAYLHYGMVSPMRLAREANALRAEKFLDELLIWREMAYGYCHYRDDFETLETLPAWAVATLSAHQSDPRDHLLSWESLARAQTEDALWNACQRSLLKHGELHNNVRMTWGKALLGWTRNADQALRMLIDLNHRYALDGRNPASYGGILWCLGQFDRPFSPPQKIFGSVRSRRTDEHLQRLKLEDYQRVVDRPIHKTVQSIAMIGGGLGGLVCARSLIDNGCHVTVFDKARSFGGRVSTRRIEKSLQFDHGAQYFTCRDHRVAKFVDSWLSDGIVQPWHGRLVEIQSDKSVVDKSNGYRLVGVPGMSTIGKHLAQDLPVVSQTKVTRVESAGKRYGIYAEQEGGSGEDRLLGEFDAVLWNCPPAQCVPLLPQLCSWRERAANARMSPCWGVMVAFSERWQVPFDGAFINHGPVRWIARDTSKPSRPNDLDCWVLHSNHDWAESYLQLSKDDVSDLLLEELGKMVSVALPEPLYRQSHRWLYASVDQACSQEDCEWDSKTKLGVCGDWFRTSNIEGALLSGMALAGRVLGTLHADQLETNLSTQESMRARQLELF